jgi:hypothetical protein
MTWLLVRTYPSAETTTPDPRLCWSRSRYPKGLSRPKRSLKNGSLANGEFGVRTTDVDEMLGTLGMANCAAFVRSGMPVTAGAAVRPGAAVGLA